MNNEIELANYGRAGYCILNTETNGISFEEFPVYKGVFTGLFFKDDETFFAIYPTKEGPKIYFEGEKYLISKDLTIQVYKEGKNRQFIIKDYGIEISYRESPFIGTGDMFSEEIDVDLFYMIKQSYKTPEFYEQYTKVTR